MVAVALGCWRAHTFTPSLFFFVTLSPIFLQENAAVFFWYKLKQKCYENFFLNISQRSGLLVFRQCSDNYFDKPEKLQIKRLKKATGTLMYTPCIL